MLNLGNHSLVLLPMIKMKCWKPKNQLRNLLILSRIICIGMTKNVEMKICFFVPKQWLLVEEGCRQMLNPWPSQKCCQNVYKIYNCRQTNHFSWFQPKHWKTIYYSTVLITSLPSKGKKHLRQLRYILVIFQFLPYFFPQILEICIFEHIFFSEAK